VSAVDFLDRGRALQVEAEKRRKRGALVEASQGIGEAAIYYLKAICATENIPCETNGDYCAAAGEIARRLKSQNINKQFGLAVLLFLNGKADSPPGGAENVIQLTGDQIKTYFKEVQKFIHLIHNRLRFAK
jgi:hypothetical protein